MTALLISTMIWLQQLPPGDASAIITRLQQHYEDLPRYTLQSTYVLYLQQTNQAVDTLYTSLMRDGDRMYFEADGLETIITGNRVLQVYHHTQQALLQSNNDRVVQQLTAVAEAWNEWLQLATDIQHTKQHRTHTLEITLRGASYDKVTLVYRPDTYQLVSAELQLAQNHPMMATYRDKGRLHISYSLQETVSVPPSHFDINQYCHGNPATGYTGKGRLTGYTIQYIPQP